MGGGFRAKLINCQPYYIDYDLNTFFFLHAPIIKLVIEMAIAHIPHEVYYILQ